MKKIITIITCMLICIMGFGKNYSISSKGIELIKKYEKCKLSAYPDSGGGWTIGWGHHGSDVYEGMIISKDEADRLFENDIKKFTPCIKRLINELPYEYDFSQGFIDGLYSLVYNCGETGVRNTPFYERLKKCRVVNGIMNEEDFNFTIAGVKISKIPTKNHEKRRYEEHLMMLE